MSTDQNWKSLHNFVLSIERAGDEPGAYRVEASREPGGEAEAEFRLPVDDRDVELLLLKLERPRNTAVKRGGRVPEPAQESIDFGQKLYKAVISGDVRDLYMAARNDAMRGGYGLRLQLRLNDAPELADLPWEFLHDGRGFVALSHETPLVRYLDLPDVPRAMAITLPLRILVMISAPIDQVPLDVDQEKQRIDTALSPLRERGLIEVDYVTDGRLNSLHKTLSRSKSEGRPYHVWHYIGHGAFDPVDQASVLVFCDDEGRSSFVVGFQLGTLMSNFPSLRVTVLNACEGARANRQDPFAGVAAALVESGISAVIGMQFPISDRAAITLSGAFYEALVSGLPVDVAITEARMNVFLMPNWSEWATPILFMRAPNGRIFDIGAGAPIAVNMRTDRPRAKTKSATPSVQPRLIIGAVSVAIIAVALVLAALISNPGLLGSIGGTQVGGGQGSQTQSAPDQPTRTAPLEVTFVEITSPPVEILGTAQPTATVNILTKIRAWAALFNTDSVETYDLYDLKARAEFFSLDPTAQQDMFNNYWQSAADITDADDEALAVTIRGLYVALDENGYFLIQPMINALDIYHTTETNEVVDELRLLDNARNAESEGFLEIGLTNITDLLQRDTNNLGALYLMAKIKSQQNDVPGALGALETISGIAANEMSPIPIGVAIPEYAFVTKDQVETAAAAATCGGGKFSALAGAVLDESTYYLGRLTETRTLEGAFHFEAWPTDSYVISQQFGEHPEWYITGGLPGHEGVDFKASVGDNVYAVAQGIVQEVRLDGNAWTETRNFAYAYGNQVRIIHSVSCGDSVGEYTTIYAQLDDVLVGPGDDMQAGTLIGHAGNSGNSTGPHLHFVLKKTGATEAGLTTFPRDFIDPWPFLEELLG